MFPSRSSVFVLLPNCTKWRTNSGNPVTMAPEEAEPDTTSSAPQPSQGQQQPQQPCIKRIRIVPSGMYAKSADEYVFDASNLSVDSNGEAVLYAGGYFDIDDPDAEGGAQLTYYATLVSKDPDSVNVDEKPSPADGYQWVVHQEIDTEGHFATYT